MSVNTTTGTKKPIISDIQEKLTDIRKYSTLKIVVGFGISDSKQAKKIAKIADGIVVGSKYIKLINNEKDLNKLVKFNKSLNFG